MAIGVELAAVGVELIPGIAGADNITIGTSTITSGTNGRVLYDNSGVIGEKTVTGTGSAVLQDAASPTGVWTMASATPTPAGGSTSAVLLFGTTAGFGIYYGSGAPTVTAAKGSLYLRSNGSATNDRMYVNTDGGTTWAAVTTAA